MHVLETVQLLCVCFRKFQASQQYIKSDLTALAGFYAGPLSLSNWNLETFFVEGGKPENPEKNLPSKARPNNKLNSHIWHRAGIEPGPHCWEVSALTTASSLLRDGF